LFAIIQCITADLVILAVYALQVAIGKENIANSFITGYYRFFTLVDKNGRNTERRIGLAITQPGRKTVGITVSRTNPAVPQFLQG
jgi:hypothetical protein